MPTSHKRYQYLEALDRIRTSSKVNAKVRPFTKIEKMPIDKYKPPRIQAKDITFNIKYGRFIKPRDKPPFIVFGKLYSGFPHCSGTVSAGDNSHIDGPKRNSVLNAMAQPVDDRFGSEYDR